MRRALNRRGDLAGSEIRAVTIDEIQALSLRARQANWSAQGRPAWLAQHSDDVRAATLRVFGRESEGVLRCIVALLMESGELRWFTIDVAQVELRALPVLNRRQLTELTLKLLEHATHVPVDE